MKQIDQRFVNDFSSLSCGIEVFIWGFKSPFGWLTEAKVTVSHGNMAHFIKYIVIWVYHVECTYLSYFGV